MSLTAWLWVGASALLLLIHHIFVRGCNCIGIPSPHCPWCMPRLAKAADIVFVAAVAAFLAHVLIRRWRAP
jgi:hypothetical protein